MDATDAVEKFEVAKAEVARLEAQVADLFDGAARLAAKNAELERDRDWHKSRSERAWEALNTNWWRNHYDEMSAARDSLAAVIERLATMHREKRGEKPVYDEEDYEGLNEPVGWETYVICDYDKTTWPCTTHQILADPSEVLRSRDEKTWAEGFRAGHYSPAEIESGNDFCECGENPYRVEGGEN